MRKRKSTRAQIFSILAGLALIPFAVNGTDSVFPQAKAAGANAGGGGNGGGQGGGHGGGRGNGKGGNHGNSDQASVSKGKFKPGLRPNDLGRLNAFMNASSTALKKSAPNSAIGIVSVQYADALSAYLDGVAPSLDDAAATLAKAANKPLTPEIVAAVNERLAAENPDNPALADLANPTNDPAVDDANTELATQLSDLANALQETETGQGLGSNQ
jgi:hypothetical protein